MNWRLKMVGETLEQGLDQENRSQGRQTFETKFLMDSKITLTPSIYFDIDPYIKIQTGRHQAYDGADQPSNGFGATEAALQWVPTKYSQASAGILDQREIHTRHVVDQLGFPGARLTLKNRVADWDLKALTESSVPTSTSLNTGTNEVEPVPSKDVAQIQANWEPKSYVYGRNRVGYFSYHNLPREVAQASSLIGNTTEPVSYDDEQRQFTYGYHGIEGESSWQLPIHRRWDLIAEVSGSQNQGAPSGLNTSYYYGGGLQWLFNSRNAISVVGGQFRVEPDAAPAYFANRSFFGTNRVGYSSEISWYQKKYRFRVTSAFFEAQVIYRESSQSHIRVYQIKLETDYAGL